jgi:hypothetical protein
MLFKPRTKDLEGDERVRSELPGLHSWSATYFGNVTGSDAQ